MSFVLIMNFKMPTLLAFLSSYHEQMTCWCGCFKKKIGTCFSVLARLPFSYRIKSGVYLHI